MCPLFLLFGERRLWTRKSTGTLRAQTLRSPSPSPPALKRNTKKLTRSLIKWCRTIGCQWVPPTTLCNPAPSSCWYLAAAAADDARTRFPAADGGLITHRALALTIPSPFYLLHLTSYQQHLSPPIKSPPANARQNSQVVKGNIKPEVQLLTYECFIHNKPKSRDKMSHKLVIYLASTTNKKEIEAVYLILIHVDWKWCKMIKYIPIFSWMNEM